MTRFHIGFSVLSSMVCGHNDTLFARYLYPKKKKNPTRTQSFSAEINVQSARKGSFSTDKSQKQVVSLKSSEVYLFIDIVTPLLHTLHWLPNEKGTDCKLASLCFISLNGSAPTYH